MGLGLHGEFHELRLLIAPFSVQIRGKAPATILYQDQTFRMTYRYTLLNEPDYTIKLGATAKIRDAKVSIRREGAGSKASRTNVGFVPLLHAQAYYKAFSFLHLLLDIDALAAPQERAEDIAIQTVIPYSEKVSIRTGYRMVEGGSDGGGNVYTFAWLHMAVIGVSYQY